MKMTGKKPLQPWRTFTKMLFFTIAATRSDDSDNGLFSKSQGFSQPSRLESSGLYACKRRNYAGGFSRIGYDLFLEKPTPLLDRAWVLQERLLSPRVIHFTDYQVLWECRSMQESETGDVSDYWMEEDWKPVNRNSLLGPVEYPFKFPHQDSNVAWQRLIAHYSHLQITYLSDRLPAIAAIVERTMRSRKDDTYIAGMWRSSLLTDCAWYHVKYGTPPRRPDITVPTWSWASISGAVGFYEVSVLQSTEVLEVQYAAIGPAHVGEVSNASMSLRGPTVSTMLRYDGSVEQGSHVVQYYNLEPDMPTGYDHLKPMLWRFIPDYDLTLGERRVPFDEPLSIMFLWRNLKEHRWFGLILRKLSGPDHERIGIADLSYFDPPIEGQSGRLRRRPRLKTCADMINSLPIKNFKIV